jgi:hypothetical protein
MKYFETLGLFIANTPFENHVYIDVNLLGEVSRMGTIMKYPAWMNGGELEIFQDGRRFLAKRERLR